MFVPSTLLHTQQLPILFVYRSRTFSRIRSLWNQP